jgi:hypothetical protein
MPSLERIASLCARIGPGLHKGPGLEYRLADATTALLLAVGSLERRLGERQLPTASTERVEADLRLARSLLQWGDVTLHTAAVEELGDDILKARDLVLDATSVLLGAVIGE